MKAALLAALFGLTAQTEPVPAPVEGEAPARGEGWLATDWVVAGYFDFDSRVSSIYTGREDQPNVALLCDDTSLRLWVGVDPGTDMPAALREMLRARDRIVYGTLSVDGEDKAQARAFYLPTHRVVVPEGRKSAAVVFNAAAKGQTIGYTFRGETTTYALPPLDATFKSWLAGCKARGAI